jgi:regulatory protein
MTDTAPDSSQPRKRSRQQKTALETAAGILAVRPCSKLELRRKLYKKEKFEPRDIEQAVRKLEELGFLSDLRFCEDVVTVLRSRGYGPVRIRSRLFAKGIPKEIIEQVMESPDSGFNSVDLTADAMVLFEKNQSRFVRESDPKKRYAKAFRFLISRGFTPDVVYNVLNQKKNIFGTNPGYQDDF